MDATVLILIIAAVLLAAAVAVLAMKLSGRSRSERLEADFGPEYDRSVERSGDRKAAESELLERQRRRGGLEIRELDGAERSRYETDWNAVQRGFVDDPDRALNDADRLVVEVMKVRGYPVDDFDRRADDISVDHPDIVHHYREARAVRDASAGSAVDTERQRHALTSYRALVEALVGSQQPVDASAQHPESQHPESHHRRADDAQRPSEERTR